jgi:hypothetical protein
MKSADEFPLMQLRRANELLSPFMAIRQSGALQPWTDAEIRWNEFAGGLNGAQWRFRACTAHDEALQQLFTSDSQRDDEERELFDFFVNGMSSIECACYASFNQSYAKGIICGSVPNVNMIDEFHPKDPREFVVTSKSSLLSDKRLMSLLGFL